MQYLQILILIEKGFVFFLIREYKNLPSTANKALLQIHMLAWLVFYYILILKESDLLATLYSVP